MGREAFGREGRGSRGEDSSERMDAGLAGSSFSGLPPFWRMAVRSVGSVPSACLARSLIVLHGASCTSASSSQDRTAASQDEKQCHALWTHSPAHMLDPSIPASAAFAVRLARLERREPASRCLGSREENGRTSAPVSSPTPQHNGRPPTSLPLAATSDAHHPRRDDRSHPAVPARPRLPLPHRLHLVGHSPPLRALETHHPVLLRWSVAGPCCCLHLAVYAKLS